jgi:hypothetical protein
MAWLVLSDRATPRGRYIVRWVLQVDAVHDPQQLVAVRLDRSDHAGHHVRPTELTLDFALDTAMAPLNYS